RLRRDVADGLAGLAARSFGQHRLGVGRVGLRGGDVALRHQLGQHLGPPLLGEVRVDGRVVDRGRLRHPGQERVLAQGQALKRGVEVRARGGRDAVAPEPRGDLAQVEGEDLPLGQEALDLERQHHGLELVVAAVRAAQVDGLDELLGDRRPALAQAGVGDVVEDRPPQPQRVDPVVLVEALVLDRDPGVGELGGHLVRAQDSRAPGGGAGPGLERVRDWTPGVDLLDLVLPDNEGAELFEAFRSETDAALAGISAGSSGSDRIAGMKFGPDDYVSKPFALEELLARVEAVIRRHRGKGGARLVAGDVVVDLSDGRATRAGRQLGLTGSEFRSLAARSRNSGQLVTYAQLAEAVWAVTTGPESNSLEVHVSRIRQKLEQDGASRLIHTVRGLGYRFSPD